MSTNLTRPRAKTALVAVAFVGAGALGLMMLPSLAEPANPPATDSEFRSVGKDGALPAKAPVLQQPDAPLSTTERGYAIRLAQQAMPSDSVDVLGNPGGEVLAAELPPVGERTPGRRVAISVYDYATDRLHESLVDLRTASVVNSRDVSGLQLPPSAAEANVATQLALSADPAPAFVKQYLAVTGAPLLAADQVRTVAGVWRDPDHDGRAGGTRKCGANRCLQLLFELPSGQYLDTHDFTVDLSSRSVLRVEPEADHEH